MAQAVCIRRGIAPTLKSKFLDPVSNLGALYGNSPINLLYGGSGGGFGGFVGLGGFGGRGGDKRLSANTLTVGRRSFLQLNFAQMEEVLFHV